MNYNGYIFIILTLLLSSCLTNKVKVDGNIPLFTENSDSYISDGASNWDWRDGEIIGTATDNSQGMLMTTANYDNFRLQLEFYADSTINSGIFIRCNGNELSPIDCHEINIWDLHPNQSYRTGAIVTKATPEAIVQTLNKWNTYRIECSHARTRVWINEILTADYLDNKLLQGHIGLQANGDGVIRFRNIELRQL